MNIRQKSVARKSTVSNPTSKSKIVNKRQIPDTIYLMRNQNQIIKTKNQQLGYKLDSIGAELRQMTGRVSIAEKQCKILREAIRGQIFTGDIQLQSQGKVLVDKIALARNNVLIYKDKIDDARKQVILQQERIPELLADRHNFQQELRIVKMQNQGSKRILLNLQEQNQELRKQNNKLSVKKYSYEPQQRTISQQIQERIRLIKNINFSERAFKKQKTAKLIIHLLRNVIFKRNKEVVLTVQRHGLRRAIIRKKLLLLSYLRKKYVSSVKQKVMAIFRQPLKPLQQQQKCIRILYSMRKRRQKAKIWRLWRNQTTKAEYSLIRRFESQNTIQKISQGITKRLLISSFNKLKYHKDHHHTQIATNQIYSTMSKILAKSLYHVISIFKKQKNKLQIEGQIQKSAQQHSKMLILSRMFYEWVALTKDKRKQSLSLKFKYFKRFKKIFVIKRRNVLSEMLGMTKIKINDTNIKSVCFAVLKQQLFTNKQQKTILQNQKVTTVLRELKQDTENRQKSDTSLNKQMAFKIVKNYLRRKTKQTLTLWRRENNRIFQVQKIVSIVQLKVQQIVNLGFSKIQKRRFQKLKLSIKDKIASCDFSYNYLVEQNAHIKQVLDKKQHELEKAKFVSIIQRLIRKQKQIKHQYFYKFLRNGQKFWSIKKTLQKIDQIMSKKIKIVLFFLLKLNKIQMIQEQRIEYCTNRHDQRQTLALKKISLQGFKRQGQKNKRMKRALSGIFERNLQLAFYQAFGKMRNQAYQSQIDQIASIQDQFKQSIGQTDQSIQNTQDTIQILTQRLGSKEDTFKQRKTMAIYKFFLKNIKSKVGSYIWKWKDKVQEEKRIVRFVKVLDQKTQSIIQVKFLLALQKTKGELRNKQLESRLSKYKTQYENSNAEYDKFIVSSEQKSIMMKAENEQNEKIIQQHEKKTQHMNNIKAEYFLRRWGKNICKFAFRQWRNQKNYFMQKWNHVFYLLDTHTIRDAFQTMSGSVRFQLVKDRINQNLSKIYNNSYQHNVRVGFKTWRHVNILKKVKQHQQQLKQAMKGMQHIQQRYQTMKNKYYSEVRYRVNAWRMRRLTNVWRTYTQNKLQNKQKQQKLQKWLKVGHSADTVSILRRNRVKSLYFRNRISNFQTKIINSKAKGLLRYLGEVRSKKNVVKNLFMNKFCFYQINQLNESFFTRIKNFYRQKEVNQKAKQTYRIQKVINCFQKKRKDILCNNMRLWKRNMYLMHIQKSLLKKVVRNAMNNRVKDLFYAWKLQSEARFMVRQHTQEGQVKKRKVQIQRLKKFLDDYKKEKGLILQNQDGNYVVSPKFQQNKEKQLKRQNILKYKFISRLILSMNGYQAPIKAWNNLHVFMKVKTKCQKAALLIKNRMQKADMFTSFKTWHNGVKQLRKMFNEMERKDLIRILNRQKDKMQIQYSRKVDVEQKVQSQLRRYKILSYQDKRKERICAQILFKQARKVKSSAFGQWRRRAEQLKDEQAYNLQERGNNKILTMQQQVHQLQAHQRQLQQHNMMLNEAVQQALQLAQLIKRISEERNLLRRQLSQSDINCQNLQEQNQELNNKLVLAQKQAMNLLNLSGRGV